jgi:glycosyltransferase involved in cell wall biosynthesis
MNYLLSIVVPTKDRYCYLKDLVKLILSFESDDIELVVQDNTLNNTEILEFLKVNGNSHIKYYHRKEPLSQSENSTEAIRNSTGEYVCFIGDDDGVTRYIVDVVKWMKENNYSILKAAPAIFKWPSFVSPKHYDVSGTALFNEYSCTYEVRTCRSILEDLLKTGIDSLGGMPKVYNGIAKRSVLEKIYNKCGTYFPGPSPDMANAVSLALLENNYVFVDFPVIIGGHSAHLGGGASRYKKGIGPLDEQPFISQEYKDNWGEKIPKVWASRTVWPESARTALLAFGRDDYLGIIDYNIILRKFIVDHWEYSRLALSLSEHKIKLFISSIIHYLIKRIFILLNYYNYKIKNKYEGSIIHRNINSIIDAEMLFCKNLSGFHLTKR